MKKNKNKNCSENWSHKHDYPIGEIWGTYHTLAQLIVPRLIAFKSHDKQGYPPDLKGMSEWNAVIQKMINAFELMKETGILSDEEDKIIEEGLALFCKYFRYLWD